MTVPQIKLSEPPGGEVPPERLMDTLLEFIRIADALTDKQSELLDRQEVAVERIERAAEKSRAILQAYEVALLRRAITSELDHRAAKEIGGLLDKIVRLRGGLCDVYRDADQAVKKRASTYRELRDAGTPEGVLRG